MFVINVHQCLWRVGLFLLKLGPFFFITSSNITIFIMFIFGPLVQKLICKSHYLSTVPFSFGLNHCRAFRLGPLVPGHIFFFAFLPRDLSPASSERFYSSGEMLNTHHIKRGDLGGLNLIDGSECMTRLTQVIYYACLFTCSLWLYRIYTANAKLK